MLITPLVNITWTIEKMKTWVHLMMMIGKMMIVMTLRMKYLGHTTSSGHWHISWAHMLCSRESGTWNRFSKENVLDSSEGRQKTDPGDAFSLYVITHAPW
jgi:hypothetical protein